MHNKVIITMLSTTSKIPVPVDDKMSRELLPISGTHVKARNANPHGIFSLIYRVVESLWDLLQLFVMDRNLH